MKKNKHKLIFIILIIALFAISCIVLSIWGKTYHVELEVLDGITSLDEISIQIKNKNETGEDVVICKNKVIEDGILKLSFESASKGKAYVDVSYKGYDELHFFTLHVHEFGIITYNDFFGNTLGSRILPISLTIILLYLLYLLIQYYRRHLKENMYQYKNIAVLGLIIFTIFTIFDQIATVFNYAGLYETIQTTLSLFSLFSKYLLPIAFIVAIFVIISNIILIKHEGPSIRNILGLLISIFFLGATILPEILNDIAQSSTWIDVHNSQGADRYIVESICAIIHVCVSYLECMLLSSIILTIKSAKHIPKFDKDAIIILGCQIKKDGTLTNLLKARVDRAIEFAKMQKEKSNKDIVFVTSGGKGVDEVISEAQAMKNYLLQQGIAEDKILIDDNSTNTYENIKFSYNVINNKIPNANLALSTTNYHVLRAGSIAFNQGINVEGIGAKTKTYFWINAFIREFIASLVAEKKIHIPAMLLLMIIPILMNVLIYLSNIL